MPPAKKATIVVTGAAGFIGSCLVKKLNEEGYVSLILVDDFSRKAKNLNLVGKQYQATVDRRQFLKWFEQQHRKVKFVFHLGARTDTTETDPQIFDRLNLKYSQTLWNLCAQCNTPLVYASSAATYGAGEHGYLDDHQVVYKLKPLNLYGKSKNDFDKWVLHAQHSGRPIPPLWAGLKFFNVYGPNEYHKDRMASVIFHTVKQIRETGAMKLFRSHRPDFDDGQQLRDFIYVKDVTEILLHFLANSPPSGLYNVGTGKARSFQDLATLTFRAMEKEPNIHFIDIPEDIRENYQYFTEAKIEKLRKSGFTKKLHTLEEGIEDYVKNYLSQNRYY